MSGEDAQPLDLFSISQTVFRKCSYGAPMVAMIFEGRATIGQSCCNHWDCPCCGEKRAKQEYRRIVNGCEVLAMGHKLYFWTLTCLGRELSLEDAEEHYLEWTNVLLTNARAKSKRAGDYWAYSQSTERQHKTRKHPHSHIICTFLPEDAIATKDDKGRDCYVSEWFTRANVSSGLGSQHRITRVENAAAVSRYVAKYMFKDSALEKWPTHWRRVRYSQNWPKLAQFTPDYVRILRAKKDWQEVGKESAIFTCEDPIIYGMATHHIANIRRSFDPSTGEKLDIVSKKQ